MKLFIFLSFLTSLVLSAHDYSTSDKHIHPSEGMETIGSTHGEIAVDKDGLIYVSVNGGKKAGVQIFDADGKYLRNLKNAPDDFHGFVIHTENGKQYLYGSRLNGQSIIKMDLQGNILMTLEGSLIPDKYKHPKKKSLRLTSVDVGPDGDIYAVDGYGQDYIHQFTKDGKYKATFGGRKAPYNLLNCHKIFIDPRYTPARILACDRKNGRLVHLSLSGELLGIFAKDLRRPSGVAFYNGDVAVAEIYGRVSILNKEGKSVKVISDNEKIKGGNNWPVKDWKKGLVITPHGICFDKDGNILVTEFNKFGRIVRYDRK